MSKILLRQFYRSFVKNTSSHKSKNLIFKEYVEELAKKSELCSEQERKVMDTHIKEYLTMRKSIKEQLYILKLNKVGVFRNQRQQVKNVARHVGLDINLPPQIEVSSKLENKQTSNSCISSAAKDYQNLENKRASLLNQESPQSQKK